MRLGLKAGDRGAQDEAGGQKPAAQGFESLGQECSIYSKRSGSPHGCPAGLFLSSRDDPGSVVSNLFGTEDRCRGRWFSIDGGDWGVREGAHSPDPCPAQFTVGFALL